MHTSTDAESLVTLAARGSHSAAPGAEAVLGSHELTMQCYMNCLRTECRSAPRTECIDEVQVIKEIDRAIAIEIRRGQVAAECIHKVQVVKEIY